MYTTKIKQLPNYTATQITLYQDVQVMTVAEVVTGWKNKSIFRAFYNHILAQTTYSAFYWELPSMIIGQQNRIFECVLLNSDSLKGVQPNPQPFKAHFQTSASVVTFPNLGGDAQLIVPTPIAEKENYVHLAQFVRHAPAQQQDDFWKMVGEEYEKSWQETPIWLSTAGLGVSWLHLRIDSRPKYYRYRPFKRINY